MDAQTQRMLQELLNLQRATHRSVCALQARATIDEMIMLRLVARTPVLAQLDPEERELLERNIATALSMTPHMAGPEALLSYVELVRFRIAELND